MNTITNRAKNSFLRKGLLKKNITIFGVYLIVFIEEVNGAADVREKVASLPILGILEKPIRPPLLQDMLKKAGML